MISNEANEDRYELYDLADDSGETTDLSARYPEKVKALRERLAHDTAQAVTPFNVPVAWPPPPPSGPKPLPGEKYPKRWRDKFAGTPRNWGHRDEA